MNLFISFVSQGQWTAPTAGQERRASSEMHKHPYGTRPSADRRNAALTTVCGREIRPSPVLHFMRGGEKEEKKKRQLHKLSFVFGRDLQWESTWVKVFGRNWTFSWSKTQFMMTARCVFQCATWTSQRGNVGFVPLSK